MSLLNLTEIAEIDMSIPVVVFSTRAPLIEDCPTCGEPKPFFSMCADPSCHSADIAAAVALDRACDDL